MNRQLHRILNRISEEYKEKIIDDSRHYIEVGLRYLPVFACTVIYFLLFWKTVSS